MNTVHVHRGVAATLAQATIPLANTYIQADWAHVPMMLRRHMLGQGIIGREGSVSLKVADTASSGSRALKVAVQMASGEGALGRGALG